MHRVVCDDCSTPCPVGAVGADDAIQLAAALGWERVATRPVGAYQVPLRRVRDRCPACVAGKPARVPSPSERCPQCRAGAR